MWTSVGLEKVLERI